MEDYLGQIVSAKVSATTADRMYKMVAVLETGPCAGRECFTAHRGEPFPIGTKIILRTDMPRTSVSDIIKGAEFAGYFIATCNETFFNYSSNVMLYGVWQERMVAQDLVPTTRDVADFFDPGGIVKSVHFSYRNGCIEPYLLFKHKMPSLMTLEDGRVRLPLGAIKRYLKLSNQDRVANHPRVLTVDCRIDLEGTILREVRLQGLRPLEMEPQV